jgi:hypothetical protein
LVLGHVVAVWCLAVEHLDVVHQRLVARLDHCLVLWARAAVSTGPS